MALCCICENAVEVKVEPQADGTKKFLNALKFEIRRGTYDLIAWHDYCGAMLIFVTSQQKNARDPKARALAIEGLKAIRQGAEKIRLVPKEFLYA